MRRLLAGAAILLGAALLVLVAFDLMKRPGRTPPLAPPGERATAILVEKGARRMTLLRDGAPLRSYDVSLGRTPVGHKQQEGDARTPEGRYAVDFKNASSRFHLALRVSYPTPQERADAARRGVRPGGDVMIHGLRNGLGWLGRLHLALDWTDGGVAVTNAEIEEIWRLVEVGTPIEIRP